MPITHNNDNIIVVYFQYQQGKIGIIYIILLLILCNLYKRFVAVCFTFKVNETVACIYRGEKNNKHFSYIFRD